MALRDRLPFNLPALGASGATDQPQSGLPALGHTPEAPDPGDVRPRVGTTPFGQSGRANFYGLPQYDELNPKLIGPQGIRRLDQMYFTDAHIRRLVLAGWSPITAGTWTLEPYGGEDASDADRKCADAIWWMLTQWMSPNFYEHLYTVGPVLLRSGFAPFEQVWDTVTYQGKTLIGPRRLDLRLPRTIWQWWQDDFGELTHIGQILPNRPAVIIPASELVYYRLASEGDNWMGTSLLRHAYKHWYIKDKLERLDAIGQERKAVGMPVVYHSPDVPEDILNGVEGALANMHVSEVAYMMLPGYKMGQSPDNAVGNQWLVDVIKFDSSSGAGIHQSLDYHQTAIAASFLTDFLELGHHQVGARATAEVQEDPFLTAINGALLPPVIPPLNRLIDRVRKLNFGSLDGSPQLKLTLNDEASLSEISAYVVPLIQAGAMQADPDLEDWLRDRAAMPAANAQVRDQKQAAQQAGMQAAAELAKRGEQPGAEPPNPDRPPAPSPEGTAAGAQDAGKPNPIAGAVKSTGKQLDAPSSPVAAGVIVHAKDTGRVLTVTRTPDDQDPVDVFACSEFPGGKLDAADPSPWAGALREWQEETGATLPNATHLGDFRSPDGNYHAFVVQIPREADLSLGARDADEISDAAWKDPGSLAHTMSPRAQALLPGLHRVLGAKQLDAPGAKRTVVVDFDGVIHPKGENDSPVLSEPPVPGAAGGLIALAKDYRVVICTARENLEPVKAYLRRHAMGQFAGSVTNVKPPAVAYVDDRAVPFRSWAGVPAQVQKQLDAPAPLSGGAGSESGLQMVPEIPAGVCVCPTPKPPMENGKCTVCAGRRPKKLDSPTPPPNLRAASVQGQDCGTCKMFYNGLCGGYWNTPVRSDWVCDSWVKGSQGDADPDRDGDDDRDPAGDTDGDRRTLDAAPEPTAKWWERLLSQDKLREAMDGCRDHIQQAVGPRAAKAAHILAQQAASGVPMTGSPDVPPGLADALTSHYTGLYHLGAQTVQLELAKQRRKLGAKMLDDPAGADAAVAGSRLARARARGEHSAQQITNRIADVLGRAQIQGRTRQADLVTLAQQAAAAQLRSEALQNAAAVINEGRADAAQASPDVIGAYYTSVLDPSTCDACEKADDGTLLSPDDALALGPPNPDCAGADRCRCALVWVLSSDPAALQMLDEMLEPRDRLLLDALRQNNEAVRELAAREQPAPIVHVQAPPAPEVVVKPPVVNVPPSNVELHMDAPAARKTRKRVIRDEDGQITGIEEEDA